VILVYPLLPHLTGFVAKSDFLKFPILPIWMKRLRCEFLIKDDMKQNLTSILNAIAHVKDGVSMFIYPEGQRATGPDETELMEFHEGSFKIATKTGCAIIPVATVGTRERFETQFPKLRGGHVIIEFGKPIEVGEVSREELKGIGAKVRKVVEEMVRTNHEKL
jgi:1-acyl-sn-glycerol-3-phosphate acyltransferase